MTEARSAGAAGQYKHCRRDSTKADGGWPLQQVKGVGHLRGGELCGLVLRQALILKHVHQRCLAGIVQALQSRTPAWQQ